MWRRSADNWVGGAGQEHLDATGADPRRFWRSRGIDPWTDNQFTLLPDTTSSLAAASLPTPILEVADTYLYATTGTGTGTSYTADGTTWTANTGGSGAVAGICSDGQYVYVADAGGIRRTTPGTTALGAAWNAHVPTVMQFAKGRIMTAIGPAIYNVTSSSTPTALYTHGNSSWTWVAFAEGPTHIFAAGYAGDKSYIYRIPIKTDGTGLDAPLVAGELPDGEIVTCIRSYLGFLFIGTNQGFRVAEATTDLVIGPLINIGQAVYTFEGQGKHVWFGWSLLDQTFGGLGRIDLSKFTGPLTPAYATDLMCTVGQATTKNVPATRASITFNGRLYFGVSYLGYYKASDSKVATGYIDLGWVGFGLVDTKILDRVVARCHPLRGAIRAFVATHTGQQYVGSQSTTGAVGFDVGAIESRSVRHRLVLWLDRSSADASRAPIIDRVTMHALPQVHRATEWFLPLRIADTITGLDSVERLRTPITDISNITNLADSPSDPLVTMVLGTQTYRVWIEDYQFIGDKPSEPGQIWSGTLLVRVKAPATASIDTPVAASYLGSGADGVGEISSGTTTLTRDMEYSSLTVANGAVLQTAGYIVRCTGTVTVAGTVRNNGSDGSSGAAGAGGLAATLPGGAPGGAPGTSTSTAGNQGGYAASLAGGNGGAGYQGAAGAATVQSNSPVSSPALVGYLPTYAGGGGGGGLYNGAAGGGGGGGGGCVVIFADTITVSASGVIQANGGAGGGTATAAAGGAGGGGGGYVGLFYDTTYTNGGTVQAAGGALGNNSASANDGVAGSTGQVLAVAI
jgi:hypothetical protein